MTGSSVGSLLALIEESEELLQQHGLTKINEIVDQYWAEIADALPLIEKLSENESFVGQGLASLVASKVYYHLGDKDEALQFALGSGKFFTDNLDNQTEYSQTLTAQCVDEYAKQRQRYMEELVRSERLKLEDESVMVTEPNYKIDKRLETIVEAMFIRSIEEKEYKQAIGTALDCMRLDMVEKAVTASDEESDCLQYTYEACLNLVINSDFRSKILSLLVTLYKKSKKVDSMNICRCLIFLDQPAEISKIFVDLLAENDDDKTLLVFQMGFELVKNATQQFRTSVLSHLPEVPEATPDDTLYTDNTNMRKLRTILGGELTIKLQLDFLLRNNNTDIGVLTKIKSLFEPRISVLHTATIVANSIMHCGTTKDTFLRENLEWLGKAIAWSKFTTTAGLGVIHKGHISEAMTVLEPYLPKLGVEASAYTEGGSLCALGLIYANHGSKHIVDYLLEQLRNLNIAFMNNIANDTNPTPGSLDPEKKKEIVQHGAALGLGLAALGTGNEEVFEELQILCFTPKAAVAGEACGIGMGLVMLGTATKRGADMLNFARQIQHEKVIRSIGLGLGFTMFGLQEKADTMIESLSADKDPVLRYGGQFTVGLAYCGTANNGAIRKLLHVAVSDVSNDVRRAAVISLGFVMLRQAEQVPRLVSLLAASYNPHVRYGAALALGIACAGTGMKEAISLLEPLTTDSVPFVRQGAFIALAMVLIQTSEQAEPKVKTIRQLFLDTIGDKTQAAMSKFGAILALGIIDAGGRNQTISLSSKSGHLNLSAIVGLTIFVQYWYWYPFLNYLSLALSPTAIIGINKNLEMPNYKIKSNAKPSLFAYPPELKQPKEKAVKALPTFQLSITKKTKSREAKKLGETDKTKEEETEKMDVEKKEKETEEKEKKEVKPEPTFEVLNNPARVTPTQLQHISFDVDSRYVPIVSDYGIVLLKDTKPEEKEELIEINKSTSGSSTENEPKPPEPFEFLG